MAKDKSIYTCSECGGTNAKWLGKCPHCGAWNTLVEGVAESTGAGKNRYQSLAKNQPVATLSEIVATDFDRTSTGQEELDRVLGGGIVAGGVVLIGGDPGIGKSTLLLQAIDALSQSVSVLYVTGEESGAQIAMLYETAVIPQAKLSLTSYHAGYEAGKSDFLNLLDSQRVYLNAKLSSIKIHSEVLKSFSELERKTGMDLKEAQK